MKTKRKIKYAYGAIYKGDSGLSPLKGIGTKFSSVINQDEDSPSMIGPLVDAGISLVDAFSSSPQYMPQPTLNRTTMRNMASPYKFAFGGSIDDLDEDQLAELQEEADANNMSVEEMLEYLNTQQQSIDEDNEEEDADDSEEFAMGGIANRGIEVEGNEVLETPDGNLSKVKGPSHENGGVDVVVPKGTKIFSDRLVVDGKTMQQRKLSRERKLSKLQKLASNNPSDNLLKNTLDRTSMAFDLEESRDMAIQEAANAQYNNPKPKFGDGTGEGGVDYGGIGGMIKKNKFTKVPYDFNQEPDETLSPLVAPLEALPYTPSTGLPNPSTGLPKSMRGEDYDQPGYIAPKEFSPIKNNSTTIANTDNVENPELEDNSLSLGDAVGIGGNIFGAIAPLVNTRSMPQKPNINRFKAFGKKAIEANMAMENALETTKNETMTDIDINSNSQNERNRNSASSVNTLRALQTANTMATNKAKLAATNNFTRQKIGVLDKRAALENTRDKVVMQGESQRDIEDKADMDNYYTNIAENLANFSENIQGLGRNLNISNQNNVNRNLVNSQAKNNIGVTRKGKIVNRTLTQKEVSDKIKTGELVKNKDGKLVYKRK